MVVLDGGGSRDTGQEVLKGSLHTQNGTFVVTGDLKGGQVKKMVNLWRRAQQQRTKIIGNLESAKKAKKATKKELPTVHSSAFLGKFLNGLEAGTTGAFPSRTVKKEPALIPEHFLWGKAEPVRPAEVIETAKVANAHNFINSSPDGYHAQIGERGVQLSSGQKQGVAIALERCSRIDPAILLDEATPALDTELEKIVQEALDRLIKGRITIVIARRLLTIQQHTPSIAAVQERTRFVHLQNRL